MGCSGWGEVFCCCSPVTKIELCSGGASSLTAIASAFPTLISGTVNVRPLASPGTVANLSFMPATNVDRRGTTHLKMSSSVRLNSNRAGWDATISHSCSAEFTTLPLPPAPALPFMLGDGNLSANDIFCNRHEVSRYRIIAGIGSTYPTA